jgi:hypothetical protein
MKISRCKSTTHAFRRQNQRTGELIFIYSLSLSFCIASIMQLFGQGEERQCVDKNWETGEKNY